MQPKEEEVPILFLHDVERHYRQGDETLNILNGVELALWPGQSVALVAPSGAGKSTLLHIAGLLEHPDHGDVYIDGRATAILADARAHPHSPQRDRFRLPVAPSAAGILRAGKRAAAADDPRPDARRGKSAGGRTADISRPGRPAHPSSGGTSGGEQQRVAIARAVANAPRILLADEPTGNLDLHTAEHVFGALSQLVTASGLAAIIATHNMDLAARMDRRVTLRDGKLVNRPDRQESIEIPHNSHEDNSLSGCQRMYGWLLSLGLDSRTNTELCSLSFCGREP